MDGVLTVLTIIGITILVLLIIILIALVLPLYYDLDVGTNNKNTFVDLKVKTLLNCITLEIMNKYIVLKVCGIKIKLKSNENNDETSEEGSEEIIEVYEEDQVPENAGFFRRLKLKSYIFERKIKEKVYKVRKTVNNINEYKYKLDLMHGLIEFIQKVLNLLKPKESKIKVEFGTGNAEMTGKLMGMASVVNAKYSNVYLIPNFEKSTLSFNVFAKGSITPVRVVILALVFLASKPVKELNKYRKEIKNA